MSAAIANFLQLNHSHKIAILGDMFELGTESPEEHAKIIELLASQSQITSYFVGNDFYNNQISQPHLNFFKTFEDFSGFLKSNIPSKSLILIKGSRGMALEKTLDIL
jgi:UDP-N-acetylmuramoyl-tripeptide--D-alanyl-D-alanine ligase